MTPTEDRYGNAKGAYNFNGKSYVEVPNSPTLHDITSAITMSAWIKPKGVQSCWISIMQKGDKRNSQFQFQYQMHPNRRLLFCGAKSMEVRWVHYGLVLDKWQHVVLTYESGKGVRFYINGIQNCSAMFNHKLPQDSCSLYIGYDPFGGPEYFIGDMDDVRLYNRVLSEKEVQELYKQSPPDWTIDG